MNYDICIIGGGASGMLAAISAKCSGNNVLLIEQNNQLGKKINLTGNGKCNLTNLEMNSSFYYGDKPFIDSILEQCDEKELIKILENLGLTTKVSRENYVYPFTESAKTVNDVLARTIRQKDIAVLLNTKVVNIISNNIIRLKLQLNNEKSEITCKKLIIATGGKAFPKTGSDGNGYKLVKSIGLNLTPIYPALTAAIVKEQNISLLSGLRIDGSIMLSVGSNKFYEYGQVQFTQYGLSGIPIFQLSHEMSSKEELNKTVSIHIFKDDSVEAFQNRFSAHIKHFPNYSIKEACKGFCQDKVIEYVLNNLHISNKKAVRELTESQHQYIASNLFELSFHIKDLKGFDFCQVCKGGVLCNQMNNDLSLKSNQNIYVIGELLDVDGKCGGYNLQWAFATGIIAGRSAAKEVTYD